MTMSKSHTALAALALVSLAAAPVAAQERYDEQTEQNEPQVEELQQGQQDLNQGAVPSDQRQQDQAHHGQDHGTGMEQPGTAQPQGSATPGAASDQGATEGDTQIRKREQRTQASARLRSESVQLSALDQEQVEELQRNLQENDFYQGEIDGIIGPATRRALRQFYNAQAKLASAGFILTRGAEALGMDQAEIERVKGEQEGRRESLRGTQASPGAEQGQQPSQRGTQPGQPSAQPDRSTTPQQPGQNDLGPPPMDEHGEPMNPAPPMEDMDMGHPGAQP